MNHSAPLDQKAKSPLIFLLLMAVLVVATLVAASDFFLRPQMEIVLQEKIAMTVSKTQLSEALEQNVIINKFEGFDKTTNYE